MKGMGHLLDGGRTRSAARDKKKWAGLAQKIAQAAGDNRWNVIDSPLIITRSPSRTRRGQGKDEETEWKWKLNTYLCQGRKSQILQAGPGMYG